MANELLLVWLSPPSMFMIIGSAKLSDPLSMPKLNCPFCSPPPLPLMKLLLPALFQPDFPPFHGLFVWALLKLLAWLPNMLPRWPKPPKPPVPPAFASAAAPRPDNRFAPPSLALLEVCWMAIADTDVEVPLCDGEDCCEGLLAATVVCCVR